MQEIPMKDDNPYRTDQELITVENKLTIDFRFAAGPYLTKFYDELTNKGKFWAIQCPQCGNLRIPYVVCPMCHIKLPEYPEHWVQLSGKGYLDTWQRIDIPQMDLQGKTVPDEYLMGVSWLDEGMPISNYISVKPHSEEENKLKRGMRTEIEMKPVEERKRSLEDIKYIKILWDEPLKEA
jgi:uncharacterized OB-fold protein